MSEATPHIEPAPGELAEPDRPNVTLIFGFVVVTLVTLVSIVVGVNELFKSTFESEISTKVLEPQSTSLRSLRAAETQRLTQYQWVNEKDGVVRIPLDRAVELTLKDYKEKRAAAQAAPAAASASATGVDAATPAAASSAAPGVDTKK